LPLFIKYKELKYKNNYTPYFPLEVLFIESAELISLKKISEKICQFLEFPIKNATQIIYPGVPHEPEPYLASVSRFLIIKKFLHKYLLLKLNGQLQLKRQKVPANKKILWLYTGKRNFGDAVMDLSGRSLLKNKSSQIDLLTFPHLKELFKDDDIFNNVFDSIEKLDITSYEFIILSEFNLPSIRIKCKYFKKIEFVCLYDFFYGPDRNQIIFSHTAINQAFDIGLTQSEISDCAKPYLNKKNEIDQVKTKSEKISIGVGGIDDNRTYKKWLEVLQLLDADPQSPSNVILLGSANGIASAKTIDSHPFSRLVIHNKVNTLSLLESRAMIAESSLYVGCDGGLMHIAHTTQTPSVSIFNQGEPPYLRLTESCHSYSIHSASEVSNVSPNTIYDAIHHQLKK
jgi:heptosyltransferase-2